MCSSNPGNSQKCVGRSRGLNVFWLSFQQEYLVGGGVYFLLHHILSDRSTFSNQTVSVGSGYTA